MAKRVYIETTIISYLTAKPSRDVVRLAHQEITREWWEQCRQDFDLYVSQLVLDEAAKGDQEAAERRRAALRLIPLVPLTEEAIGIAGQLTRPGMLAEKAGADALHLAVATVHRMDFLLTWNCRHLANGKILAEVGRFIRTIGYELPFVGTPEELMGSEP